MVRLRGILDRLQRPALERAPLHNGGGLAFGDLYPSRPPPGLVPVTFNPTVTIAAATSTRILANANGTRRTLVIVNDGTANLYVNEGPVATTSTYTQKLPAGASFVLEGPDVYKGEVAGVWDVATGFARVTER